MTAALRERVGQARSHSVIEFRRIGELCQDQVPVRRQTQISVRHATRVPANRRQWSRVIQRLSLNDDVTAVIDPKRKDITERRHA